MTEDLKAMGTPTKQFFVNMLTRDIDLRDAILDLLDNCLDGVVRQKKKVDLKWNKEYYSGFHAKITITSDKFVIEDNCGGIPLDIARKYAFRMGKDPEDSEGNADLPTVGVYGIGMKRAIFKMGNSAKIISKSNNHTYSVSINESWITDSKNWDFPIEMQDRSLMVVEGTKIEIENLNDKTKFAWSEKQLEGFVDSLRKSIEESYSFIVQKGFSIEVNEKPIVANPINVMVGSPDSEKGFKPYVFEKAYKVDEGVVNVKFILGFYNSLHTQAEDEEIAQNKRSSSQAGWTVTCNDRVVLYNDKTYLTGWGEKPVPSFHNQFIGICGVVMFESIKPKLLPMTTTKRGIDLSSPIYSDVKNYMRDALKMFTSYTNIWKGRIDEERKISSKAEKISVVEIFSNSKDYGINLQEKRKGKFFEPTLPKPKKEENINFIRYSRPSKQIDFLRECLFCESDPNEITPTEVGEKCFDKIYLEMKEKKNE